MASFFDRIDVNCLTIVFSFLTIEDKLLPFLSLSKSVKKLNSPAAFKENKLILSNERIELINPVIVRQPPPFCYYICTCFYHCDSGDELKTPNLVASGNFFTNIEIIVIGDKNSLLNRYYTIIASNIEKFPIN